MTLDWCFCSLVLGQAQGLLGFQAEGLVGTAFSVISGIGWILRPDSGCGGISSTGPGVKSGYLSSALFFFLYLESMRVSLCNSLHNGRMENKMAVF